MDQYRSKIENSTFVSQTENGILQSLNSQVEYASFRCSFYAPLRERLPLGSVSAFEKLPFTTAEDIRTRGKEMLCVPASKIQRIVSLFSSGTTHEPKRIFFTENDLQRTVDFFAEGMGWMCESGDTVGVLLPCSVPDGVGDLLSRGLENLGCTPLPIGLIDSSETAKELLLREKPSVLVGMPWQVRLLALTLPELRPERVLLSADYVPENIYHFLEKLWDCRVLGHFGMTETCFGGAVECLIHRGMYLRRDELYAEIIDPFSGKLLPAGEVGELVITTLRREAMPLIRYRTGDLACMSKEREGLIERVFGRIEAHPGNYILQESLCTFDWLYDYSLFHNECSKPELTALISSAAPEKAGDILLSLAAESFGLEKEDFSIHLKYEAKTLYKGKRLSL